MKREITFASGIAAGVTFIVACQHAGKSAHASPSDCAVWQAAVIQQPYTDPSYVGSYSITDTTKNPPAAYPYSFTWADFPAGWEPVQSSGSNWVIRRCKP